MERGKGGRERRGRAGREGGNSAPFLLNDSNYLRDVTVTSQC